MKLVNPVGRDLTELETEVYSCHCICSSGSVNAKMSEQRGEWDTDGCQCYSWGERESDLDQSNSYGIRKNN
ncbi:CA_C0660 family putative sactipeptide bacteriocin [Clostridium felsineum]|uniref:CA_C0660 family putative sactipeptide bacteriocin n=1 Tax=Clostridium felsineum TaxID=36839 RepID=UPI00098BEDBE|nr:CA_C0660 family putative sactipeptide bacteriocin [Clostridium felsineum]URZ17660.1 hypothetical protein CLFE_037140 [Clostridium felsineum DSM 794]